jgi:hypothetical protein
MDKIIRELVEEAWEWARIGARQNRSAAFRQGRFITNRCSNCPVRRTLRYAATYKDLDEPLRDFIKRKGGINKCASRVARRLGRGARTGD